MAGPQTLVPEIRFRGFSDEWEQNELGKLASITTGRLDANAATENGEYAFFTCGKETLKTDQYAFQGEAILVSGNGDLGFTRKYCGKFNAYQRTYVLQEFQTDYSYLEHAIKRYLPERIKSESFGGAMPYIKLDALADLTVFYPGKSEIKLVNQALSLIDSLVDLHTKQHQSLLNIKKSMLEKMFPQDGSNVPEIRFAGFTNPWEQRKLKDAFDFLQNNTLSRADLSLESGAAKNVHYGDVLIKFGEYLDATETTLPYIPSQQIVDKYKGSTLQDGDVIMADTAEDETVGKCTEIANLQGFPTISGLHTIPLRPKGKFATGFLGYYMNSGAYHDQLLPLMQGIKVTSISKGALLDTVISYPSDIAEQAEIGRYFINLDNLITLHQRKYEMLQKIKNSLLQKMLV